MVAKRSVVAGCVAFAGESTNRVCVILPSASPYKINETQMPIAKKAIAGVDFINASADEALDEPPLPDRRSANAPATTTAATVAAPAVLVMDARSSTIDRVSRVPRHDVT